MHILQSYLGFITQKPSINISARSLTIRNGFLTRVLTLFCVLRKVEIIPEERVILYNIRLVFLFCWFQRIAYSDLSHIDYSIGTVGSDLQWVFSGIDLKEKRDAFTISLVTMSGEKYVLCYFKGTGPVMSKLGYSIPDKKGIFDFSGIVEEEAVEFADYLSKFFSLPVKKNSNSFKDING